MTKRHISKKCDFQRVYPWLSKYVLKHVCLLVKLGENVPLYCVQTFMANKKIKETMPRDASFHPIDFKCVKKCFQAGIKSFEGAFMPNKLLIWALPIVIAAAVVKPFSRNKKEHFRYNPNCVFLSPTYLL